MSVLEIRHEFVDVDARNVEQLYQAFSNQIYLGEWELARISLQLLYQKRLQLNTNLEAFLTDIIRNPTAYCTGSNAIPTPFHFALLLLEECRVKQYLDTATIDSIQSDAIFHYLLAVGDIQPTSQVVQEFERLHTNTSAIPSDLLTDSMADFLVDLWLHEIARVHAFIRLYLYSNLPSIQMWLMQIHKRALEIGFQQLKTLNTEQQKSTFLDLIFSLNFYSCESNEFRLLFRDILKKILIYVSQPNQLINLKIFYEIVLNNGYLGRFLGELESEYRRELINNETIILHFLKKNSFKNEEFFWKEIYLYLIENKIDLISCVLNDAINLIQNRDYSSLDQLLNLEPLQSLHLYIFLLAWTHVRTVNDAIVLFDLMNSLKTKSPLLVKCLQLFQSHREFITWLYNVRRIDLYHDGVSPLPNMSDLLALLHMNSPLSLIHRYLDVPSIDSLEILEKLKKTEVDINDEIDQPPERRVRFKDSPESESVRLSQTSATMIFLGYLSVNNVIEKIVSPTEFNDDYFAQTRTDLMNIYPLRFRLELLENLFSLAFIQQSELKMDETIETLEQSTNTVSERLLSSIQSQMTNDSVHTSTNASIKTQVSVRKYDDLDENNTQDDLSIHSSSMSSVSLSHSQTISRQGLLINENILYQLLIFLRDQLSEVRTLYQKIQVKATDRDTIALEYSLDKCFLGCSIHTTEQFTNRASKLNTIISETLWRYQLLTVNKIDNNGQEAKIDGYDDEQNLIENATIKHLILPIPPHRRSNGRSRRSRLNSESAGSINSLPQSINPSPKFSSSLVSQILSTRDNLLAICLKEGKITEANEVIRLFNMQDHPLAVEAKFSKLFHDTINQLITSHQTFSSTSLDPQSPLAGLANLASSALGNSSLQNDITPLLELAQQSTVSSTLPSSIYFDSEYFLSLTLFDLALNAPTMSISKILLDMSQHRLPLLRSVYSTTTNSTSRIKSLNEMITNYLQLTNASLNQSFEDILLDVTIPLDGLKATKILQYYKRLDEHCRQYYINEQNSFSLEQQVKATSDLFENDSQAKIDLISYLHPTSSTTNNKSSTYLNYFSIFHNYLQNFRLLLEKFPLQDLSSSNLDLSKHSPLSLIHRIVSRSIDIDLTQLQILTSKLNIDISLAVSLNIIRPLFVDKTIATSSLSSTARRMTILRQQSSELLYNRQQSCSILSGNLRKQMRRSATFLRRLTNKSDEFQNETETFNEHPEKFIRTLLTKLINLIRKILDDINQSYLTIEHIDRIFLSEEYEDILNSLPLLTYLDLDRLSTFEDRTCFFTNFYNFFLILSHLELIHSSQSQINTRKFFRNQLEYYLFLLTTRINIGQLKQISLFDIRYYILKQTIPIDALQFQFDRTNPLLKYAPEQYQHYQQIQIGLILNDCLTSSCPFVILIPELFNEQLQRLTREFIEKCILIQNNENENSIDLFLPKFVDRLFDNENILYKFLAEFSSNNQINYAINEKRSIRKNLYEIKEEFAINFDYYFYLNEINKKQTRRRSNSLPASSSSPPANSFEFLSQTNPTILPNHLIDSRTIAFVQEKSPALGQILQIYVQSVVQNQPIENDRTPLNAYFQSLLLSPTLIESTTSIAEEWFRSIVLNDLIYQHDLLLYFCSILWINEKYAEIVQLFDSLLPAFIVHSTYCQILRDLALLHIIKQTSEPDHAFRYLRKIRDCHLLVHATLTYLPRFDGPTCLKLLELCLTSCKKTHQDYIPLLQERLNIMYVYKTLCLSALAQFNKCMEKISKDENQLNMSIEDMAIKKTSSKCLTWQRAEEHSQIDPLAVANMFIYENEFDMGHKWLNLLKNSIDEKTLNRVRLKLVEEHIHWLLREENIGNGNKILQVLDFIENLNDKWHLCTDLITDLSKKNLITYSKSIPFSRLFVKFRLIQYMLGHFDEKFEFFQGEYDRSKLSILATGLALFFNCIPLEQTDSYVQLISQPLLIIEQLLMNSSVDIAKITIESLKILIEKYQLENCIQIKQIDQLIEFYTKKSVQLNVGQVRDEQINTENKQPSSAAAQEVERRQPTSNQRKGSQDTPSLGRRQNSAGTNHLFNTLRHRKSSKTSISSANTNETDMNLSSSLSSPTRHSPPMPNAIPIKSQSEQQQSIGSSSFIDYLSTSLTNRNQINDKTPTNIQHAVPVAPPSKKLWISDDEVTVCMCCKETQFSMFNRRHHCRRCGRVVCKTCSQHTTIIKDRLARTCNDCYQYLQSNPTQTVTPRQEPTNQNKKFENFRPLSKPITSFKRQSISQLYLDKNLSYTIKDSELLFGTSLVNDTPNIVEGDSFLYSASYSTSSPFLRSKKIDSPQKQDIAETLALPIITDDVQYQLTGTAASDEALRNDFHYDQSPSITLCLSLIELHSNQYEGGKLLIKLCEYLSEQLSTKQRNTEIDYGLVLNIIKNLLYTAKMKLITMILNEDQIVEQQKLIASCDLYNNLVDILNRLNMANCSLPALNDLLQQDTLRKIRNQLLDDERYQLAMDISTRCNLDTQSIWYQWGMAYLYIGQYLEAREKFDKCLQKNTDNSDAITKQQQQRGGLSQDKMLSDIIAYLETSLPLKYAMKWQYLAEQQIRQTGQTRASLKYLNSLSTMPRLPEQAEKVVQDEILYYLSTYSDDAHLLDYYMHHELYTQAFEHKCSLTSFRDHIYLPLLKRNHTKHLFNYILSRNNNSFTHHLRFVCTYLKEQDMYHSLQQLQLFMNDFINAGSTSIKLFTMNRTTYIDLYEKRLVHLQKALDCFQHAKIDSEQTMTKVQSNKNRVELQIEITKYVHAQLKRLKTDGADLLVKCPTLFDSKDVVAKLILGLITIADTLANAFALINKIIKELNMSANEIFIPCAEDIGKRHDYRSLQQFLQLLRDNGYTDPKLHDDVIEACVRESGSDAEQSREQDALIQLIKNDDSRIQVYIAVGKLRAAYLIAIRLGKEDKVRLIRDEAQKSSQTAVYDICKKWLENRANEQ